ncbi:hypothetical protein [Streptomyces sp. NBC_01314]|nr:hypothetical protein OG622_33620 [Streptomyces sp. NBC_01314]
MSIQPRAPYGALSSAGSLPVVRLASTSGHAHAVVGGRWVVQVSP